MKIAIGADHAGFRLKETLRAKLAAEGHEVVDFGTSNEESTAYPDYAEAVGRAVELGDAEKGILVCSTGVGMSIAANKLPGIRAGLGVTDEEVALIRKHNDANVLAIGARTTPPEEIPKIVRAWFGQEFAGGRHAERVDKIRIIENSHRREKDKR